ncbi:glutamate racemase [Acidimicrobium ferrooxidans DSM 10331]|uniref:Glutamate racemase n=1 Tax=Acidimicrobium ferrooxidans (strain DSM 10331 / JCM 15462 / NBRC 103882 / ICP) TaxID=525909 RepID=C7M110_ACIFD|nr:glutamate racemase [Acidimicrobium ferrooxidans]ACU54668.1 glutamate racemase [Acidimicrobium ferrooxidans DSM 10331]
MAAERAHGPIGVFDSGFGGLNILAALRDLLPSEDLVYFGDSARSPYGSRPADEVVRFSLEIGRWLVDEAGSKLVVVGCNTASAVALDALRAELAVPVIGVVGAGARAARRCVGSGRVGVIGTERTIASGAYQRALADDAGVAVACPGLVEFVEAGQTTGPAVRAVIADRLAPVVDAGVEVLLLGCTHYPYLAREIQAVVGEQVTLVSPAEEAAFEVAQRLGADGLARSGAVGSLRVACSGDPVVFREIGGRLFPGELGAIEQVPVEALECRRTRSA